jgi:hypothetical protein
MKVWEFMNWKGKRAQKRRREREIYFPKPDILSENRNLLLDLSRTANFCFNAHLDHDHGQYNLLLNLVSKSMFGHTN